MLLEQGGHLSRLRQAGRAPGGDGEGGAEVTSGEAHSRVERFGLEYGLGAPTGGP
jgi:hypothetical protein